MTALTCKCLTLKSNIFVKTKILANIFSLFVRGSAPIVYFTQYKNRGRQIQLMFLLLISAVFTQLLQSATTLHIIQVNFVLHNLFHVFSGSKVTKQFNVTEKSKILMLDALGNNEELTLRDTSVKK